MYQEYSLGVFCVEGFSLRQVPISVLCGRLHSCESCTNFQFTSLEQGFLRQFEQAIELVSITALVVLAYTLNLLDLALDYIISAT